MVLLTAQALLYTDIANNQAILQASCYDLQGEDIFLNVLDSRAFGRISAGLRYKRAKYSLLFITLKNVTWRLLLASIP
jgi:hypothetical protein